MSKCQNEKCGKTVDTEWDTGFIWIGCDGDLVCSEACKNAYHAQVDHFYSSILPNDKAFYAWMGIPQ
jgi:hypothetical protein